MMLWPVLMPLCSPAVSESIGAGPLWTAVMGIALHALAMVTVTTAAAVAAYEWLGLEILRRAWINVDMVWTVALAAAGAILLVGS